MAHIIKARLPFDSQKNDVIISQGYNGPYSHNDFFIRTCEYDLRYALDFILPLGTVVSAVRDGIVRYIIPGNGRVYEGADPVEGRKAVAASITLANPDITESSMVYTQLHHLDPESFCVKEGEAVQAGQPLAKTGRTGWIGDIPHLHMHFEKRRTNTGHGSEVRTLPFFLRDYDGPLEDAEIIRQMAGDSREVIQKILAGRRQDGYLK